MKTHFILFTMCVLGLLINARAMTDEDKEDDEFHHGFSMSDGMDEDEEILSLLTDQKMEGDDVERMADPLRLHIRIRRPQSLGFGIGGAGLGGLGLSGGFGHGFDDDESHEDEESSMRSSDSLMRDDDDRNADPLKIHFHIRRPSFRLFDPRIEMKQEDITELMADPQFRIRIRALFGRSFGFGRRLRIFFGRRAPFFFADLNNDGHFSETQPTTDDIFSEEVEENFADPLTEDVKIQARIGVPGRDRFSPFRRPRISLDKMITKPKKLSPPQLLARVRARSALLYQRFGLLSSNSFWCRRFGSVKCGGRRRPYIPRM